MFVCVTGVSGSGKSTLVNDILYRQLAHDLHQARQPAGRQKDILGKEYLDKVIAIDQAPIGRTPRSNPATTPVPLIPSGSCLVLRLRLNARL